MLQYIRALTKAQADNLAREADAIVKRMHDLHEAGNKGVKPNGFTYNAALLACGEERHTKQAKALEAFTLAIELFNEQSKQMVQVSIGNMLRCANLLPEGGQKDSFVRSTFTLGCRSGFINELVVRDLESAGAESTWRALIKCPSEEADVNRLAQQ